MPDIAELGLSIDTRQVVEGNKVLDSFGEAASRVEKRAGALNGQMNDTSKIMRAQAEQARANAQATTALGGSTTQLTLGQQQLIERMREQAATIGMSRTQLLAYQAAQMGVTQETQQAIATIKAHEDALKAATKAKEDAAAASGRLTGALGLLAAGFALLKVADYIKESALLAARYETLGVVMEVVGRNAGYTKTQMMTATDAIARQGITMVESRESAVKLVQAHVDLKNATALARIAQDAAVIGHLNSSDAFDRLVNGISRGNVLILRNIGINVNLQTAYRQMADSLGKTTKELTENERVQARLNAVIERGADIAGTYEAAMGTAGKQLTSMQRYTQDLKTSIGETFNEVLTVSVMAFTAQLKDANGEVSDLSRNNQLAEWGHALAQVFVVVADNVNNAFSAMKLMAAGASYLGTSIDITKQYAKDIASAGFSVDGQVAAYEKQRAAVEANKQALANERDDILAGEDKFQKAFDERTVAVFAKRRSDTEAKLKIDADYMQKSLAIQKAYAGYSLEIQQDAQLALANSIYVGTPNYRDSAGREPKPKVDQAENTAMADHLARIQDDVNAEKAIFDQLAKLNEMFHKAGRLGDEEYFKNKRDFAKATATEEVNGYTVQIAALRAHHSVTEAEAAKHAKKINDLTGKRAAAEAQADRTTQLLDMEEMLRKDALGEAAVKVVNKEVNAINAQIAAVEEQIRTFGLLPAAKTALAVADLEEQKAALAGFENNDKAIDGINRKIEALNRLGIVQSQASKQEQGSDVTKAKELLDILTSVDTAARQAAQGMADSFGAVGTAIGSLTTALTGYERTQAGIAAQLAAATKEAYGDPTKIAKAQAAAAQQGAQAQIKSYGDMASAAKGFFKENSSGYRALEGAEKAYRAFEMAMAIQSMVTKSGLLSAFTGLFVTAKATETAATVASVAPDVAASAAKGVAAAAVGVATQAQGDPYTAWARMAAMAAAMAALGFAVAGGGGSDTTAKDRQAATGTGSVLGDSFAKSESIAHSLAIMEKNSGLGLAHTISMDSSLKQMVAGIGNLSSLLARSGVTAAGGGAAAGVQTGTKVLGGTLGTVTGAVAGGVGGAALGTYLGMGFAAIGGPLGLAIGAVLGSVLGGVVSKLFNTSTSIKDQGITGKAMSLGNVDALGFTAQAYADINTKKKAFGISYSNKNSTQTAALSDEMNDQLTMIITSMGDTIRSAADVLDLGGAAFNAKLNTFVVDLGKISLKDLKGEEQQKALETAFSKMGDDMAKFGVTGLQQYQAVGEGYLETLVRVTNDYMQVSDVLAVLGKSFNTTGLGAVALSEGLIAAAGGLDKLTSGTGYFVQNFLTEAERMAPITKSVNDAMGKLGVTGVTTVDQFKALVLAQNLNTSAGQAMYAQLIALAEPFKTVADYAAELAGGLADVAKTASEIASERKDLQSQLDQLTLTSIQLREKERAGLDASNRALYDQVQAATAVAAARDVLSTAYDRESSAITATIDKTKAAAAALRTFLAGMLTGDLSPLSDASRLAVLRSQMATATPDTVAASSTAYLQLLKTQSGSALEYARGFASAQQAIEAAAMGADAEGSVALQQLSALDKSVAGIIDVNKSVISVRDALAAYAAAGGIAVPADGGAVVQVVNFSAPAGSVPASQNQANDTAGAEVVAELKLLREEMKLLRAAAVRGADAAVKGAELLDNVSGGGGAFLVEMESA